MMFVEEMLSTKHLKSKCVCCEEVGKEYNQEHVFPKWLLRMSNAEKSPFRWLGKAYVAGQNCTIPLCKECNSLLGKELETKVQTIFTNIEAGNGINDYEADILIRWIWKIAGMLYRVINPEWYQGGITLKQHVLTPIVQPRERISIAISIIEDGFEDFGYAPVGLDSVCKISSIYCAGVFSRLSIIVLYTEFIDKIPNNWGVYTLSKTPLMMNPDKKFYPPVGFEK